MTQQSVPAPLVGPVVPSAIPWYRRNGWVTAMFLTPPLLKLAADGLVNAGVLSKTGGTVATAVVCGLLAVLMPIALVVLVTGPVYGGRDKSGRWHVSTKVVAIGWALLSILAVVIQAYLMLVAARSGS